MHNAASQREKDDPIINITGIINKPHQQPSIKQNTFNNNMHTNITL